MKTILIPVLGLMVFSIYSYAAEEEKKEKPPEVCQSTREYVTTLEFLRSHKEFEIKEPDARKVADQVSTGCSGAARRFVLITNLLVKSNLATNNALEWAVKFSKSTDEATQAFITIFRSAFLRKYLDLDIHSSMRIASALSLEFNGNHELAQKDFEEFVEFCLEEDGLNYPKPRCAEMAARLTRFGERYEKRVSPQFKEVFSFLKDQAGKEGKVPDLVVIAERVVSHGPTAVSNFKQAYLFAKSKTGLDLQNPKALDFASQMASRSNAEELNLKR